MIFAPTFDGSPLDLLAYILFLFRLQGELNEDLLKLFVDIVDTKLLEAVVLEDLETAEGSQRVQ